MHAGDCQDHEQSTWNMIYVHGPDFDKFANIILKSNVPPKGGAASFWHKSLFVHDQVLTQQDLQAPRWDNTDFIITKTISIKIIVTTKTITISIIITAVNIEEGKVLQNEMILIVET